MKSNKSGLSLRASLVAAVVLFAGTAANAALIGNSAGRSLRANVGLLAGGVGVNVGPLAHAWGNAPTAYTSDHTVASVSAFALGVADLDTGVLDANALSNINGGAFAGFVSADATVDDLDLAIVPGTIIIPDLITLTANTISSNVQIGHDGTNFSSLGGINIENAFLRVAGVGTIAVNANAAPNTVLLDALGIRIVLNEQITTSDALTMSRTINAIHISITGPLQVVNADVVIAQSVASLTVPSCSTAALLCPALLTGIRRRRNG